MVVDRTFWMLVRKLENLSNCEHFWCFFEKKATKFQEKVQSLISFLSFLSCVASSWQAFFKSFILFMILCCFMKNFIHLLFSSLLFISPISFQQIKVYRHKIFARFGLMHMIGTNLSVWFSVLIQETKHEILTFYDPENRTLKISHRLGKQKISEEEINFGACSGLLNIFIFVWKALELINHFSSWFFIKKIPFQAFSFQIMRTKISLSENEFILKFVVFTSKLNFV